ncbi:MAG: cytidine deaminase [candidate division SR1 bacterium CG_4_9_14_3_um_filter_40_9]|nr:MAG: cytidine deaminase [candidate division SR1 bacterium CG_4_9_14_3_um_filter_40_9]
MITKEDKQLIEKAKTLVGAKNIRGGTLKEVGCVLITEKGKVFSGVSLHLACGIGFCAEHTAISQMITQTDETHIKTIVATNDEGAIPLCGRCRELMNILDAKNMDTEIIIADNKKVKLRELLPFAWEIEGM